VRRVWALVVLGLLVSGCGDSPAYDASAVESHLVRTQAAAYGDTAKVTAASCPAHEDLREGMTLTCSVTVGGARVPYAVRLTHVHSDHAMTVSARPQGVLLSAAKLRAEVQRAMPKGPKDVQVVCGRAGASLVVARVGQKLACQVVLGSQTRPISITVKDAKGRVSISS
jgi:hypothetical protein